MDVERLAQRLKPLQPEQVRRWKRTREHADSELRILLDRQLVSTARHAFGEYESKLLLSLPPKKRASGPIKLGTLLYDKERWPLGISKDELLQNMAIFGRSGAGKTNAVFHIIRQLETLNIPWVFLDWKRTARHLLPHLKRQVRVHTPGRSIAPLQFNAFAVPPGLEPGVYANHVVDALAAAFTLGDGATSIIQKALRTVYAAGNLTPSTDEILRQVELIKDRERIRGWKISATRAVESVHLAGVESNKPVTQKYLVESLVKTSSIIELDALAANVKSFLVPILCLWLYNVLLSSRKREQLQLVIIVEEAHHVFYRGPRRTKESLMNQLMRQCREIGIAMVVVDQHPHLISSAVLGNTYTSLCLNLKDPGDIQAAAGISGVDEPDRRFISQLPVGQAIVKLQDRLREPVLVQIPHVNLDKGAVTDDLLLSLCHGNLTRSALRRRVSATRADVLGFRVEDWSIGEDESSFIEDVLKFPRDGVDRRYKRLGFSGDKGTRLKRGLVQRRIFDEETVAIGRTRRVLLRISRPVRHAIDSQHGNTIDRASITHAFWQQYYAQSFRSRGYQIAVEAPVDGGRVDLVARERDESVAIEIETGQSDVLANVRRCLRARFDRVIVVVTSEKAFMKIERILAREGLLLPRRIQLVLRDKWLLED